MNTTRVGNGWRLRRFGNAHEAPWKSTTEPSGTHSLVGAQPAADPATVNRREVDPCPSAEGRSDGGGVLA